MATNAATMIPATNVAETLTLVSAPSAIGFAVSGEIADFDPVQVVKQVPALAALLETREKLRDLMSKADRSQELENLLEQVLRNEGELKALSSELGTAKGE